MGPTPQNSLLGKSPSILGNHPFSTIVHGVQVTSSPYVASSLGHVSQAKEEPTRNQPWILAGVVDRELVEKGGG